eukprot:sb/3460502/
MLFKKPLSPLPRTGPPGRARYFLSHHSGHSNAYTGQEDTNYYYFVHPEHLSESLDRFSTLLAYPTLELDAMKREMHAIESEFRKDKLEAVRQVWRLVKHLSSPKHPLHHLSPGNLETLSTITSDDVVRDFHGQYYTAEKMACVVYGREGLGELRGIVEKHLVKIPASAPTPPPPIYLQKRPFTGAVGSVVEYKPLREGRELDVIWPLGSDVRCGAGAAVGLLNKRHPASAQSVLKGLGWATSLQWSVMTATSDVTIVRVNVKLTSLQRTLREILGAVGSTVEVLAREEVRVTSRRLSRQHEESLQRFINAERQPVHHFVKGLSARMVRGGNPEHYLGAPSGHHTSSSCLSATLSALDLNKAIVLYGNPGIAIKTLNIEPWYGIQYTVYPIPPSIDNVHLVSPPPLPSQLPIPHVHHLLPSVEEDVPWLVAISDGCYWQQDSLYHEPRVDMVAWLYGTREHSTARSVALHFILGHALQDLLEDSELPFSVFYQSSSGLIITYTGYSDMGAVGHDLSQFTTILLSRITSLVESRYEEVIKHRAASEISRSDYAEAYKHPLYNSRVILEQNVVPLGDVLEEVRSVSRYQFTRFYRNDFLQDVNFLRSQHFTNSGLSSSWGIPCSPSISHTMVLTTYLVEHAVFLGDSSHPHTSNTFEDFLSHHSGHSNAYTGQEDTNYYYFVHPEHLSESLDRFSTLLAYPTLELDAMKREMHAIESEFRKDKLEAVRQVWRLVKHLSSPKHPLHHLSPGNLETLSTITSDDVVRDFHGQYYTAEKMACVVYGREGLGELRGIVEKHLVKIPASAPTPPPPIYLQKRPFTGAVGSVVEYKPLREGRELDVIWPLGSDVRCGAGAAVGLLNKRHPASAQSVLKGLGWATSLQWSVMTATSDVTIVRVNVKLTSLQRTLREILGAVGSTVEVLAREEVRVTSRRLSRQHEESLQRFINAERQPVHHFVKGLSARMVRGGNPEHYLGAPSGHHTSSSCLSATLSALDLNKAIVLYGNPGIAIKTLNIEPWYGIQYTVYPIPPSIDNVHLVSPPPLPSQLPIPHVHHLLPSVEEDVPWLVAISDGCYWQQDSLYHEPRVDMVAWLYGTREHSTARSVALHFILGHALQDLLEDSELPFSVFYQSSSGLIITYTGYSDMGAVGHDLSQFTTILLSRITSLVESRYEEVIKHRAASEISRSDYAEAYKHPLYNSRVILEQNVVPLGDVLEEVRSVSRYQFTRFYRNDFLQDVNVRCLIYGNIGRLDARDLAGQWESIMFKSSLSPPPFHPTIKYPPGTYYTRSHYPNPTEAASVADLTLIIGPTIHAEGSQLFTRSLLARITAVVLEEPAFHQLRTVEQLGYSVFTKYISHYGIDYIISRWEDAQQERFKIQPLQHQLHRLEEGLVRTDSGVIKSTLDSRDYSVVQLSNGLKVLLISDPDTVTAAASCAVAVGSYHDPVPGLAHLVEHAVFLGDSSHPHTSNTFEDFLSHHSGHSNAYTGQEDTNYYYFVHPEHLSESLDRFSTLLAYPTLELDAMKREMHAIESEFRKDKLEAVRQVWRLVKHLSSPKHPLHHLSPGNLETLSTITSDDVVRDFHGQYYTAEKMACVVYGREGLGELRGIVEKHLVKIPASAPTPPPPIYLQKRPFTGAVGSVVEYKPLREGRELDVIWPLGSDVRCGAGAAVGLLNKRHPASAQSVLKGLGWATSLQWSVMTATSDVTIVRVNVKLTSLQRTLREILGAVGSTVEVLAREEVRVTSRRLSRQHEESLQRFINAERQPVHHFVKGLSARMVRGGNPEHYLGAPSGHHTSSSCLSATLSALDLNKAIVLYGNPGIAIKTLNIEPWYGIQYTVYPIPPSIDNVHLVSPPPLPSQLPIPHVHHLLPSVEEDVPWLVAISDGCYWQQDSLYHEPRVDMVAWLYGTREHSTARSVALHFILGHALQDLLEDSELPFSVFYQSSSGLIITYTGYSDMGAVGHDLSQFTTILLSRITSLVESRYEEVIKHRAASEISRSDYAEAYKHPLYNSRVILEQNVVPLGDVLEEVRSVSRYQFTRFYRNDFLQDVNVRCLIYGNIGRLDARDLAGQWESIMFKSSLSPPPFHPTIKYPPGTYYTRSHYPNPTEAASVADLTLIIGPTIHAEGSQLFTRSLLARITAVVLEEPAFHQLRTVEQLGYSVFTKYISHYGIDYIHLCVQGSEHSSVTMATSIFRFLDEYRKGLLGQLEHNWTDIIETVGAGITGSASSQRKHAQILAAQLFSPTSTPLMEGIMLETLHQVIRPKHVVEFYDEHVLGGVRIMLLAQSQDRPFGTVEGMRELGNNETLDGVEVYPFWQFTYLGMEMGK